MNFSKLVKKISIATYKHFCHGMLSSARSELDRTSRLAGLDIARPGPDQTKDIYLTEEFEKLISL